MSPHRVGHAGLMAMIIIVFVSFSLGAAWMGRYGIGRPGTIRG